MLKTSHMLAVESRHRRPLQQLLRLAWEGEPSYHGVVRALEITPQTARRWMIAMALEPYSTLRKRWRGARSAMPAERSMAAPRR